ncbi:MAG: hypothetical protein L6V95_16070 [Candidatus Melainabacteria bacterium]|nr:MAG: hypothetical protein L6V95_16070 [Candidatus Melainabacteria bacterium]
MYDEAATSKANTASFVDSIKSQIDYFQTQLSDFDVLVIYIYQNHLQNSEKIAGMTQILICMML